MIHSCKFGGKNFAQVVHRAVSVKLQGIELHCARRTALTRSRSSPPEALSGPLTRAKITFAVTYRFGLL